MKLEAIILIGHPSLNKLEAIILTPHLAMKFASEDGKITVVKVDQMIARECYLVSLTIAKRKESGRTQSTICSMHLS